MKLDSCLQLFNNKLTFKVLTFYQCYEKMSQCFSIASIKTMLYAAFTNWETPWVIPECRYFDLYKVTRTKLFHKQWCWLYQQSLAQHSALITEEVMVDLWDTLKVTIVNLCKITCTYSMLMLSKPLANTLQQIKSDHWLLGGTQMIISSSHHET